MKVPCRVFVLLLSVVALLQPASAQSYKQSVKWNQTHSWAPGANGSGIPRVATATDALDNSYVAFQLPYNSSPSTPIYIQKYNFQGQVVTGTVQNYLTVIQPRQNELLGLPQIFAGIPGRIIVAEQGTINLAPGHYPNISRVFEINTTTGAIMNEDDFDGLPGDYEPRQIVIEATDRSGGLIGLDETESSTANPPTYPTFVRFDANLGFTPGYETQPSDGDIYDDPLVLTDGGGNAYAVFGNRNAGVLTVIRFDRNMQPSQQWPADKVGDPVGKRLLPTAYINYPDRTNPIAINAQGQIVYLRASAAEQYTIVRLDPATMKETDQFLPSLPFATQIFAESNGSIVSIGATGHQVTLVNSAGQLKWTWQGSPNYQFLGSAWGAPQAALSPSGDVYFVAPATSGASAAPLLLLVRINGSTGAERWEQPLALPYPYTPVGFFSYPGLTLSVDSGGNAIVECQASNEQQNQQAVQPFTSNVWMVSEEQVSQIQTFSANAHFFDNGSQSVWSTGGRSISYDSNLISIPLNFQQAIGYLFDLSFKIPLLFTTITVDLGKFGYGVQVSSTGNAALHASVQATGGNVHINAPMTVTMSAPEPISSSMRAGKTFNLVTSYVVDPAASMSTDPAMASAKLDLPVTFSLNAALQVVAFSQYLVNATVPGFPISNSADEVLFDTSDYTSGKFLSLFGGLLTGYAQIPSVSTSSSGGTSAFSSSGQDAMLTLTLDVTGLLATFTPFGPIFANDLDIGIGDIGWQLLAAQLGVEADLAQSFKLNPGAPTITLLDSNGNPYPVLLNGVSVTSFPAGSTVGVEMPTTTAPAPSLKVRPVISLPNPQFTNQTGIAFIPFYGFDPFEFYGGFSAFGLNLGSFDWNPLDLKGNLGSVTLPIFSTTFPVSLGNPVTCQPITIAGDKLPQVLAISVPGVESFLYNQTFDGDTGPDAAVLKQFANFESGTTTFLVFGTGFDSGTQPHLLVNGHDNPNELTYVPLYNPDGSCNTLQVTAPNWDFMVPGMARVYVQESGFGPSNTLDLPITPPIPNPSNVSYSLWAGDPGFTNVPMGVVDGQNCFGYDTFLQRTDYWYWFQSLWQNAPSDFAGLPTVPAQTFFPDFNFGIPPALPTIHWNGTALQAFGQPVPQGGLWGILPHSAIVNPAVGIVTVIPPGSGGLESSGVLGPVSAEPPQITALTPAQVVPGSGALTLQVTGPQHIQLPDYRSNFNASSQVLWNGAPVKTKYVSSSTLIAYVSAGDVAKAGTASISVNSPANGTTYFNGSTYVPAGGTSNALALTIGNPPAVITRLSPNSTVAGLIARTSGTSAMTVTIEGTGFGVGCKVTIDGVAASATRKSAVAVLFAMPAGDLRTARTHSIVVINPDTGASQASTFTVLPPATLTGTVSLASFTGNPNGQVVDVKIYQQSKTSTGSTVWTQVDEKQTKLNKAGQFTVTTPFVSGTGGGALEAVVKVSHWLSVNVGTLTLSSGQTTSLTITCAVNGDVNGDNEINSADLTLINSALGSKPGNSNWNANADLNGDGIVNQLDVQICTNNQGLSGQGP